MAGMEKEIGAFVARNGKEWKYRLTVHETFEDVTPFGTDVRQMLSTGLRTIRTVAGDPVNRLEKGKYQLLDGTILISTDPNAV